MTSRASAFYVGRWLVEPTLNQVSGAKSSARVEPKVMGVLVLLARRQGQVVTREELLETVWEGTVVTEDVLTRSISALRKVFGDDRKSPQYIETIPKTGYRLVAPVSEAASTPGAAAEPGGHRRAIRWGGAAILLIGLGLFWIQRSTRSIPRSYQSSVLTSYAGTESNPELSPDGSQVAFAWRGRDGDNLDVYTRLVTGEGLLRLTESEANDFKPTWSPDGNRIAFIRWADACSIYVVSVLGGPARRLGPCGDTIYPDPAWSPDGRWIAMNGRESTDEPFAIYLVSANTLERRQLTSPPSGTWGDHNPAFSPDGQTLSFTRSASEGIQDLFVVDTDDGEETQLTDEARNIWGHTWVGSSTIVFSSNRAGRAALWEIDVRNRQPVWLGVAADDAKFPTWSSGRLAFVQSSSDVNIWMVPVADTARAGPIAMSSRWDMHPRFSPDGTRIAFTSNRSGSYEVWTADSDGGNEVRLTDFRGPFTSSPKWSPDGARLLFTSRPEGNADVYVVPSAGGLPEKLTSGTSDELAPSWLPGGEAILMSSNRTGRWEVYRLDLESGALTQITRDGGLGPQIGPEGAAYYAKQGRPGVWTMDLGALQETQILDDLDTRDWGSWRVVDGAVIFLRRGRPNVVLRHSLGEVGRDTLFIPVHGVPTGDPALDADATGTKLLLGQIDRSESDLMLIEGFRGR